MSVILVSLGDHAPTVDHSAWLAPGCTLTGDVTIDADASIWYGAVLRADDEPITVGAGSNVQDNCVLHVDAEFPLTIGSGVSVGHGAIIHGATVGDDVLVGMGAVIMNGAVIGSKAMIAAGALVPAGMDVPPRSLVAGVPGKVRRDLTDEEVEANGSNAANYRLLATRHRAATAPG
jgi:carbonic anhydrase/acetyltransferase-like protein (isoleucine patch superfamily)